ncbi:MAG: hypothetical protein IJP46_09680 [Prevotella sp.]|nr:hypothetical protein [Prevotella sp.]
MKQQKQLDNETRHYVKWVAIGFAIFTMACGVVSAATGRASCSTTTAA